MARRKTRYSTPLMLFWSKRDQRRFIEAVERFVSLVNDLDVLVSTAKRKRQARLPAIPADNGAASPLVVTGGGP